jgi:CTP synthase (UTP-ammonia lyase)
MTQAIRVGILGDFNRQSKYHSATNKALREAGASLSVEVYPVWLATPMLAKPDAKALLAAFDALWCAPGSPYKSMEGALNGIQFAREKGRPFVGT